MIDEIHKVARWEEYGIDLSRNPNWKVVVTGSSSRLLKDEIATDLALCAAVKEDKQSTRRTGRWPKLHYLFKSPNDE